jgi:hypothetical protein
MATRLVILNDTLIRSMASNEKFVRDFPFLGNVKKANGVKRRCCGGGRAVSQILQAAKGAFAGLSPDKRKLLKQLLNAEKVRVTYRDSSRRMVEQTF